MAVHENSLRCLQDETIFIFIGVTRNCWDFGILPTRFGIQTRTHVFLSLPHVIHRNFGQGDRVSRAVTFIIRSVRLPADFHRVASPSTVEKRND